MLADIHILFAKWDHGDLSGNHFRFNFILSCFFALKIAQILNGMWYHFIKEVKIKFNIKILENIFIYYILFF